MQRGGGALKSMATPIRKRAYEWGTRGSVVRDEGLGLGVWV